MALEPITSLSSSCHRLCTQVGDQRGDHLKTVLNGLHPCRYREHTYAQGWGRGEKGWDKWKERNGCVYTKIRKQTANGNSLCDWGNSGWGSGTAWRGGREREVGGRLKTEGVCVHLWPIHVDAWQESNRYYKPIINQLKRNKDLLKVKSEKISIKKLNK